MIYTRYTHHCFFNKEVVLLELDEYIISLIAENVNIWGKPKFKEFYHLNGQPFDGIWIDSQRIDGTNIQEWIGVTLLNRVKCIDIYTEKTHDHIDVSNLNIKCMVRKRNPGSS